jgi:transposase
MVDTEAIERRFKALKPVLDERMRRLVAAAESLSLGYGGASIISRATGVSRRAIAAGVVELGRPATERAPERLTERGIRRRGGGRKRTTETDPTLKQDLERLVDPVTRGDPESPLRWTCKSVRKLAEQLNGKGHQVSHRMVAELLHELDYSLQANRKSLEGSHHPDPRRPVSAHQPKGAAVSGGPPAGDFGRYQEEGTGRGFQEWGPGTAAERPS